MTIPDVIRPPLSRPLLIFIEAHSGQPVSRCNQCGKCTAGCPAAWAMDLTPRQVMRALQLGLDNDVLASSAIWLCLSCQICSVRCPLEIDVAKVMHSLRHRTQEDKTHPGDKNIARFHGVFRGIIHRYGRIYELGLAGLNNMVSRRPWAHLKLFPAMLRKGKLPMRPSRIKATAEVKNIFQKVAALEERFSTPSELTKGDR
ncbi:MAG: 4Fe-4S dicluster domain-containing protein [Chloroflexi bacterium]|nr:4Fe-4S dicluster domain-containing protein [Chloroflexota bacterium]